MYPVKVYFSLIAFSSVTLLVIGMLEINIKL